MFLLVIWWLLKCFSVKPYRYHMYSHDIEADQKKLHIDFCCIKRDVYFQKLHKFWVQTRKWEHTFFAQILVVTK